MEEFLKQLDSLCECSPDKVSLLANASALLNEHLDDINWVGFYLFKNNELILGPFQGKIACTRIQIGKGVCGTSFQNKTVLNVKNVHEFKGHIACDSRSNSEIVIPLHINDTYYGVLDIDSTSLNRFTKKDEDILIKAADIISKYLK